MDKILKISEIESRKFKINTSEINCIDGRNTNNKSPAIAGWVVWVVMAIFKTLDDLQITDEEKRKEVINFLKGYFNWFSFHSDTHVEWWDCKWCGHIKHSLFESIEEYWLSENSIGLLKEIIWEVEKNKIDILEWNHEEKAVILVEWTKYWIKSNHNGEQFFVYNIWFAKQMYNEIAELLLNKWILKLVDDLWNKFFESWHKHFLTTWWKLAVWLPIYQTQINEKWEITSLEKIWIV